MLHFTFPFFNLLLAFSASQLDARRDLPNRGKNAFPNLAHAKLMQRKLMEQ
jgi:hypothetical protein